VRIQTYNHDGMPLDGNGGGVCAGKMDQIERGKGRFTVIIILVYFAVIDQGITVIHVNVQDVGSPVIVSHLVVVVGGHPYLAVRHGLERGMDLLLGLVGNPVVHGLACLFDRAYTPHGVVIGIIGCHADIALGIGLDVSAVAPEGIADCRIDMAVAACAHRTPDMVELKSRFHACSAPEGVGGKVKYLLWKGKDCNKAEQDN
jgi:hypothetical protein